MRSSWLKATLVLFILFVLFGARETVKAQSRTPVASNTVCAECHDVETKLKTSAHAGVACASCHIKHETYPHPENIAKPQCGTCHAAIVADYDRSEHAREVRKGNAGAPDCALCHGESHEIKVAKSPEAHAAIPETCGMCHEKELADYKTSIHGQAVARGVREAPVCTDCHGPHSIESPKRSTSKTFATAVPDTCGRCHGDVQLMQRFGLNASQVSSFSASFHGLALKSGQPAVADCASCHGFHKILPSTDRRSSIHPANVAKTCGTCHPGAGTKFSLGRVHAVSASSEPAPIQFARWFYLMVIPGTIGFMFLHQAGDFLRKMYTMRFRGVAISTRMMKPAVTPHLRMHRWERVEHLLLALSFILLAYTGFALHYPGEWWSSPILRWEKTYPVRGTVHRAAAAVLVCTSIAHMISLLFNARLRKHWFELLPRWSDARELYEGTLWRLGLRKQRPYQSHHSYIEKLEYWALIWGTAVMALTGVLLWANNWTLQFLPKMWMDLSRVIHYYEAVLATLAILVWHFYTVIFDPEVYPMDPSWLTGYSPRPAPEEHPQSGD